MKYSNPFKINPNILDVACYCFVICQTSYQFANDDHVKTQHIFKQIEVLIQTTILTKCLREMNKNVIKQSKSMRVKRPILITHQSKEANTNYSPK
jgi:hypothetical protein